ncbi:DDB1- and CUL4-associated factor 11 [Clonorchis sinensis]|uniref:DDB1-and CUL4-associated factor 11 n=1 Tax=Clonorchis sinensis TaxID=79923 RepID=H2KRW3_CLOSI|nr:DDB1- and CUL4-associated factor 11 [Clonorchis sinensis]
MRILALASLLLRAENLKSLSVHLISLDKSGTRDRVKIVDDLPDQGSVSKTFSVCFDGTGTRLISGNDLGYLRIHDIESGACELTQASSNKRDMNAVTTLDAAGHVILAGSDDTTIRLFDSRALKKGSVAMFTGHMDGVTYLDSKGDGVYFLSNSKDQTVRLWDLRKHTQPGKDQFCRPRANWDYRVHSIPKTYTNPRHWHSGSSRGDQSVLTLRGHTVRYTLIRARFSPAHQTGQRYAYAGSTLDGWCIWDLFTGELIRRNSHGPHAVRDVYWHPWEPLAMASELNGSLSCWKSCTKDRVDPDEAVHSDRARFELCDPDGGRYRNRLAESGLLYRFPNETEIGPPTSGSSQSTISDLHQDDAETMSSIDTDDSTLDTEYEYIVRGYSWAGSDESDPDFAMDVSDVQNYTNDMGENSHIPVTRSQTRGRGTRRTRCRRSRDVVERS